MALSRGTALSRDTARPTACHSSAPGAPPPRRPSSARTPLIIGGVALLLVLALGVVLILSLGGAGRVTGFSSRNVAIPDANATGVTDTITLDGSGAASAIQISVDITHPYTCDLVVQAVSPQGAVATLADSDQCTRRAPNLALRLDSRQGGPELAPLVGQEVEGPWQLRVVDEVGVDSGTLVSWSITAETS